MRPSIRAAALAAASLVVATAPLAAFADNATPDGDVGDPSGNLQYGAADCDDMGTPVNGSVNVKYAGSQHFTPGEAVTIQYTASPGISVATTGTVPNVPSNWNDSSDNFTITFETTVAPGTAGGSVEMNITGGTSGHVAGTGGSGKPKFNVNVHADCIQSNTAPVAVNDSYSTAEDTALTVVAPGVLGNDTDADGDSLTAVLVSGPSNGSVTLNADGSFGYTPNANFNGSDSFTYKANDGTADSNVATVSITVTPVNDAPVVTPGAGSTSNEGDTVNVSATFVDPDGAAPYTASINWGDGHSSVGTVTGNSVTGSHAYEDDEFGGDDNYTVTISVTDSGTTNGNPAPQTGSATLTNHVNNVAPTVATPTVSVNGLSGVVSLSTTFTDPAGSNDTYSGKFVVDGADVAGTVNQGGMSMAGSITLAPGCHTIEVSAAVSDEDGGTGTSSTIEEQVDVYTVSFLAPIRDDVRNIAKYGNVVPVKVQIGSSCSPGTTITDKPLFLTVAKGEFVDDSVADDSAVVVTSVSNADTGTQMRVADGKYIYNLSTKTMKAGEDYTIRIRTGSDTGPVIAKALFQPKK